MSESLSCEALCRVCGAVTFDLNGHIKQIFEVVDKFIGGTVFKGYLMDREFTVAVSKLTNV